MVTTQHFQDVAGRVSRALGAASADSLPAAVDVALEQLGCMIDVDLTFLMLVDGQEQISDTWHWARPGLGVIETPVGAFSDWFGSAAEILRLGATIPLNDLDAIELAPSERQLVNANGVRALMLVPVRVGDVLLGVVGIQVLGQPRTWHRTEVANVELVAQLIVQAVVRTRDRGALAAANLRARRIAEYLPDRLLFLNTDLEVRWASPAFTAAWSAADGRLDERHVFDLVHPEDRPALASILTDAPIAGAPSATVRVRSHGGWRWTDLTCQLAHAPSPTWATRSSSRCATCTSATSTPSGSSSRRSATRAPASPTGRGSSGSSPCWPSAAATW